MACGTFGDGINNVLLDHCFCMYILSVFLQLQLGSSCSWQSRWLDWGWRGWREEETDQLESWEQKTCLVINMFQDWGIEQQQQLVCPLTCAKVQVGLDFIKGWRASWASMSICMVKGDSPNSIYRSAQHNWRCPFLPFKSTCSAQIACPPFFKIRFYLNLGTCEKAYWLLNSSH